MLKYHSLRDKVFSLKSLYAAFGHVKKNKGKAGLDRVSIKQFETNPDVNIMNIHQELKTAVYNPAPVLQVYIPKGRHDKRPLGIPIVKDRVVQQAFRQIIEPIFEKAFSDNSFGFRPDRCCHDTIKRLEQYKQEGYTSVLDADIMAFHDTIPHKLIMDSLREKAGYKFVRYADDFVVMTKTKEELPAALCYVKEIIEGKLGMKLGENTTKLANFKRGFRFSRKWKTDNKRFPVHRFAKMGLLSFERAFLKACAKA